MGKTMRDTTWQNNIPKIMTSADVIQKACNEYLNCYNAENTVGDRLLASWRDVIEDAAKELELTIKAIEPTV